MTHDTNHQKTASGVVADEARKATEALKSEAGQLADEAKETARQQAEKQFEKGQNVVASQVDTLSSAIDDAASTLNEQDHPLGHYTREIADSMAGLSHKISNSSLDELASDTRKLARENPGLFMLGSIAIGVAASRFFKATTERSASDYVGSDRYGEGESGPGQRRYGSDGYERSQAAHSDGNRYATTDYSRSPPQRFSPETVSTSTQRVKSNESDNGSGSLSRNNEAVSSTRKDVNVTSADKPERV